MSDFVIKPMPQVCASAEAESNKYHMVRQPNGYVFLWKDGPSAADNIYCGWDDPDKREEGFGGRTLTFDLVEGGSISLHGPWHTNADHLYRATKVDLRNQYSTFVVVAKYREYKHDENGYQTVYKDVLHQDEGWVISDFDRGNRIALKLANKLGHEVFCYQQSSGGSSDGPVYPESEKE